MQKVPSAASKETFWFLYKNFCEHLKQYFMCDFSGKEIFMQIWPCLSARGCWFNMCYHWSSKLNPTPTPGSNVSLCKSQLQVNWEIRHCSNYYLIFTNNMERNLCRKHSFWFSIITTVSIILLDAHHDTYVAWFIVISSSLGTKDKHEVQI